MNEEKGSINEREASKGDNAEKKQSTSSSRARNRTVMLTPEMTGQVRELLRKENPAEELRKSPLENLLPPITGWESPDSLASSRVFEGAGSKDERPLADLSRNKGTATLSRDEIEHASHTGRSVKPAPFDPLTSLVPLQGFGTPSPSVDLAQTQAARPIQPSFSVNQNAAASPVAAVEQRAPRVPAQVTSAAVGWHTGASRIVGFLISFDKDKNGEVFALRSGRWLITSRPTEHGDYILVNDPTISPLHAILRASKDGKLQVLDQLSEFGTGIFRAGQQEEIEIAGGLENVGHGDTVRFGERYFLICIVPEAVSLGEDEKGG